MVERGPSSTDKEFLAASEKGDAASVLALLEHNSVDVNARDTYWFGWTSLHYASEYGYLKLVQALLHAGANVNAVNRFGETPLHRAASNGNVRVVKILLQAHADVNAPTKNGATPLHDAASEGHLRIVEQLVEAKADFSALDVTGLQPLHLAAWYHQYEVVRFLLARGVNPRPQNNEGFEPIHFCLQLAPYGKGVTTKTLKTLQRLVSCGAVWDTTCDGLIVSGIARKEALALRICILTWAQEHAKGLLFTDIPLEIVKRGVDATQAYIEQLESSNAIICRLKVCVVGPSKAGKTSLVTSLTTEVPSLIHPNDRTIGVNHVKLRFTVERDGTKIIYEVIFWDFAGQDQYHVAHSVFYSKRTLYLVCVDMQAFLLAFMQAELMGHTKTQWERLMNEIVERDVLRWVRSIFTHQPDAEFVFIVTKCDLLAGNDRFARDVEVFLKMKLSQVEGIVKEMKLEVKNQLSSSERRADMLTLYAYQKRLEKRRARDQSVASWRDPIEDSKAPSEGKHEKKEERSGTNSFFSFFGEWYTQLFSSIDHRPETQSNTKTSDLLFTSCTDAISVGEARRAIIALIAISDRSVAMPDNYTTVLNAIIKMRNDAADGGGDARIARTFARTDALMNSILQKVPEVDYKTCRIILLTLHDLGDVIWYEDLGIGLLDKTVIIDPMLLIDFVRQVITHKHSSEMLAHTELKRLPFWINLHTEIRFLAMKQMLQKFQLVYPSESEMQWDSDLIVPAYWNSKTPASWLFGYEDIRLTESIRNRDADKSKEQVRVHWQYHFAFEFPDTLFDHLIVATHSSTVNRKTGPDWILYAEDGVYACRAMISRESETAQRILQLEAVLAVSANEDQTIELWEAFECLSVGIIKVRRRYPGLVVTSVALDDRFRMRKLDSLFGSRLQHQSRTWMPHSRSWELYKQTVQETLRDESFMDTWMYQSMYRRKRA